MLIYSMIATRIKCELFDADIYYGNGEFFIFYTSSLAPNRLLPILLFRQNYANVGSHKAFTAFSILSWKMSSNEF